MKLKGQELEPGSIPYIMLYPRYNRLHEAQAQLRSIESHPDASPESLISAQKEVKAARADITFCKRLIQQRRLQGRMPSPNEHIHFKRTKNDQQ